MKCNWCGHTLIEVNKKDTKGQVEETFIGRVVHKNIGKRWSHICRVKKCGCLQPEPKPPRVKKNGLQT